MFPMLIFAQKKGLSNDSLQPGTSTSVSFVVENTTTEDKIYDIRIETSSSHIVPILEKGDLKITSQENNVYIVPLKIAPETPPGKYTVILNGTERKTGEELSQRLQFSVSTYRKIELSALDFPEFVKA